MDLLNTLTAWQWALLAAVPPAIVALYFLKLRREPLEVPSTYLWRKSIEDLHVNSLWQRIRNSLLLYLQLLAVALVMFALLRPGWRSGELAVGRSIFLIDNSASMNATDIAPSRLAEAKRRAIQMIDQIPSGDEAMVISFADDARVEQGFTSQYSDLRKAVENIQPTNRATNIDDALRTAAGLSLRSGTASASEEKSTSQTEPTKLFILSDEKFPPAKDISLGNIDPVFISIGQTENGSAAVSNVGIVAFSAQRNENQDDRLQAFGSLQNFGSKAVIVPVDLYWNGSPIDASQVTVPTGGTAGVAFNLGQIDSGVLELRLNFDDALAQDNRAWVAVKSSRRPDVLLVTPGNEVLKLALSTPRAGELANVSLAEPTVLQSKEYRQAADRGDYDLVIYDRCHPSNMPQANTWFIAATPPPPDQDVASGGEELTGDQGGPKRHELPQTSEQNLQPQPWSLGATVVHPQIIDVDLNHPLLEWADLADVDIAEARPVTAPAGGKALVDSNKGTLLAIADRDQFEDAVMGFEIYGANDKGEQYANTNWPIRRSFPTFVYAVLEHLANRGAIAGQSIQPGQPIALKSEAAADEIEIRSPSGTKTKLIRNADGEFRFYDTGELGAYEVLEQNRVAQRFTVNLFDPAESDIRPATENSIQIGHVSVAGQAGYEPVRREFWKWLALGALVVLLLEWYTYIRRISV